jgi:hypothetical protein
MRGLYPSIFILTVTLRLLACDYMNTEASPNTASNWRALTTRTVSVYWVGPGLPYGDIGRWCMWCSIRNKLTPTQTTRYFHNHFQYIAGVLSAPIYNESNEGMTANYNLEATWVNAIVAFQVTLQSFPRL